MRAGADAEIDAWPVGEPFRLLESIQALTLRVIVRAVFGYAPGAAEDELSARLRAMVAPLSRARGLLMISAAVRGSRERESQRRFAARKRAVDEVHLRRDRAPARRPRARASATTCSPPCSAPATRTAAASPIARCATSC